MSKVTDLTQLNQAAILPDEGIMLNNDRQATTLTGENITPPPVPPSPIPAVNVAQVPQRSPLRYPGGKTWLVPHIREWLGAVESPTLLIEPFAGGAITSLTAVMEELVPRCILTEIDPDVAAFWQAALHHGQQLTRDIDQFTLTRESIDILESRQPRTISERGFRTLVLNRARRGGILAKGAALTRTGENGKGVASRWYPETIKNRLAHIVEYADRIDFREADGMALLEEMLTHGIQPGTAFFVDPPYTAQGKQAGQRLYTHSTIDHPRLFHLLGQIANEGGEILATYDESPEIKGLVRQHGFHAVRVMMKNTHHQQTPELVITNHPVFL